MSVHNLVEEVKLKRSGKHYDFQPDLQGEAIQMAVNGLVNRFQAIVIGLRSLSITDKETLTAFIDDARAHADALVAAATVVPSAEARDAEVDRRARDKASLAEREKTAHENAVHAEHVKENEVKAAKASKA